MKLPVNTFLAVGLLLGLGILLGTTNGSILTAQCLARCYQYQYQTTHVLPGISYELLCANSTNCSSCVIPCFSEYKLLSPCQAKCEFALETSWCYSSCHFLKLMHQQRRGSCPNPETITGFGKACAETCSNDSHCPGLDKCCYNGCGHTCQEPVINRSELPPKPRNYPVVTENPSSQSITLRWELRGGSNRSSQADGVVLFVVQARNNTGHHPSRHLMADWADVAITDSMAYVVELSLGNFYRFQVAAVNENGSLGYCKPTLPYKLRRDPQAPSQPQNVRQGQFTVSDGRINVRITWDPPKTSDLRITRYRVFYSERRSTVSAFYFPIEEHSRNVPGDEHDILLESLHPDMRYFIQVQAIAQWGNERMRSERTPLFVDTIDIQQGDDPPRVRPVVPIIPPLRSEVPSEPRDVTPDEPYWEDQSLKTRISWKKPKGFKTTVNRFMIHWQPMGCANDQVNSTMLASTHNLNFDIYDLKFDCQYRVSVVGVTDGQISSAAAHIRFYTLSCNELKVKGREKPSCPTPIPDIPSQPANVSYIFMLSHNNITAQFLWRPPVVSLYGVIGYRIMWAEHQEVSERLFGEGFPLLERMEHVMLSVTTHSYSIGNLRSGMRYRVQIQALSSIGGGAMAVEDIKTPRIVPNTQLVPMVTAETATPMITHAEWNSTPSHLPDDDSGTSSWHEVSRANWRWLLVIVCLVWSVIR